MFLYGMSGFFLSGKGHEKDGGPGLRACGRQGGGAAPGSGAEKVARRRIFPAAGAGKDRDVSFRLPKVPCRGRSGVSPERPRKSRRRDAAPFPVGPATARICVRICCKIGKLTDDARCSFMECRAFFCPEKGRKRTEGRASGHAAGMGGWRSAGERCGKGRPQKAFSCGRRREGQRRAFQASEGAVQREERNIAGNGRERVAGGTLHPFRRPPYRRPPGFAPSTEAVPVWGPPGDHVGSAGIRGDCRGKRVGARRTAGEHRERIGKSRGRAARSLKTSGTTPGFPPGGISAGTTPGNAARVAGTWPGQRRGKSAGGRARRRGQVLLPPELPA